MKKHRTIICIGACAAAVGAVSATPAFANSLLSGYGGPGQGNQAILGSALINGPGGGNGGSGGSSGSGGAGSSGSGSSSSGGGSTAAEGASNAAGATRAASGAGHEGSAAGQGSSLAGKSGEGGASAAGSSSSGTGSGVRGARVSVHGAYPTSERVIDDAGSGPLGLSGGDFLYILLALGLLALMGVLTRRLSDATVAGSGGG